MGIYDLGHIFEAGLLMNTIIRDNCQPIVVLGFRGSMKTRCFCEENISGLAGAVDNIFAPTTRSNFFFTISQFIIFIFEIICKSAIVGTLSIDKRPCRRGDFMKLDYSFQYPETTCVRME